MSIVKEGYPFIFIPLIAGLALILFGFCLISFIFGIVFVLSPCNGTVLEVSENDSEKVIRVFLSVLDVHLQRAPIYGKVESVKHQAGKFLKAMDPQAHIVNEQNIIVIRNDRGVFIVKQIAGILARRCVAWVKAGDEIKIGDKIGVIKFSSQVDLHFPKNVEVKVKTGDKVVSGVSVFGEIR